MVLLYDFFNGDLKNTPVHISTPMEIVDKSNLSNYLGVITQKNMSEDSVKNINFKNFSKAYNKQLETYDFSFLSLFNKIR